MDDSYPAHSRKYPCAAAFPRSNASPPPFQPCATPFSFWPFPPHLLAEFILHDFYDFRIHDFRSRSVSRTSEFILHPCPTSPLLSILTMLFAIAPG
eukprot:5418847-Pleurochrysis_carterae.AAC.1